MKIQLADRMKGFEEGIFQVLNEKKTQMEQQGHKIYNLSVGTACDRCGGGSGP